MKAKDLIHELEKFDQESDVAIYNSSMDNALIIPDYEPKIAVSTNSNLAEESEMDSNTIFIMGK